jgi:uncharacterized membrane protein
MFLYLICLASCIGGIIGLRIKWKNGVRNDGGLINAPTYFKLKAMQIITNDLNTIDLEDLDKIQAEVEDGMKQR